MPGPFDDSGNDEISLIAAGMNTRRDRVADYAVCRECGGTPLRALLTGLSESSEGSTPAFLSTCAVSHQIIDD